MNTMVKPIDDAGGALSCLRAVFASIESGELRADTDEIAYLRGAIAALEGLAEPVSKAGH